MFCTHCGNPIADDSVFCSKCGKRVEKKVSDIDENGGESSGSAEKNSSDLKGDAGNMLKASNDPEQAIWNSLKSGSSGSAGSEQEYYASCVLGGRWKGLLRSGRWIPETRVARTGKEISITTKRLFGSTIDHDLEQSDIRGVHTKKSVTKFRIFGVILCLLVAALVVFGAPLYFAPVGVLCAAYNLWVGLSIVLVIITNHGSIEIPVRYENEEYRLKEVLNLEGVAANTSDVPSGNAGGNPQGMTFANDHSNMPNTYSSHTPVVTKVVQIAVIGILLLAYISYYYAWSPGWGGDLSDCLGKKIGMVRLLHSVKKEDTFYSVGDGEYYLLTDANNRVVTIGAPGGTEAKKYHINGIYAGQSQREASDRTTRQLHTVLYDNPYYVGCEGEEGEDGSDRYMQIVYRGSQIYSLIYLLDYDYSYEANMTAALAEFGYTGDTETADSAANNSADNSTNNDSNIDSSDAQYDPYAAPGGPDFSRVYEALDGDDDYDDDEEEDDEFYSSDYILPNSSTKKLKKKDLEGLTKKELRLARNEIYARHGRLFQDGELQSYFNGQDWYYGTIAPEDFDDAVELNAIERYNAKFILKYE